MSSVKKFYSLIKDKEGAAFIEAAFIMPIIILMLLASHELGSYIRVKERMQRVATDTVAVIANMPHVYAQSNFTKDYANGFMPNAENILNLSAATAFPFSVNLSVAYCQKYAGPGISTVGTAHDGLIEIAHNGANSYNVIFPQSTNYTGAVQVNKNKLVHSKITSSTITKNVFDNVRIESARCSAQVVSDNRGFVSKSYSESNAINRTAQAYIVAQAWTIYNGGFNPSRFMPVDFGTKGDRSNEAIVLAIDTRNFISNYSNSSLIP